MSHTLLVDLAFLPHHPTKTAPQYQTDGAAGVDLVAAIPEAIDILPNSHRVIPTGLRLALPSSYEAQVRSRSGLAATYGVSVLNSPGTIDSDYRGEIQVILQTKGVPLQVVPGMRIAQLVFSRVERARFLTVEELGKTPRGQDGLGSTGVL